MLPWEETSEFTKKKDRPDLREYTGNNVGQVKEEPIRNLSAVDVSLSRQDADVYSTKFKNGLSVLIASRPEHPIDYFGIYFKGGRIYESQENSGISQLLMSAIVASSHAADLDGLHDISEEDALNRRAEWLGGYLEPDVTADISGVRGFILEENLTEFIPQVVRQIFHPCLPSEGRLRWLRKSMEERIRTRQENLFHRSIDSFYQTVFGVHPYGLPRYGDNDSLRNLTTNALYNWHDGWIRPSNAVMTFVTSKPVSEILQLINHLDFQVVKVSKGGRAEILSMLRGYGSNKVLEFDDVVGDRSLCVMGFPLVFYKDSKRPFKLSILEHALVGPGGLLSQELDPSWSAEVRAFYVPLAKGEIFFLYVESQNVDAELLRAHIQNVLKNIIKKGLDEEQFRRAQNFTLTSHRLSMQAPLHHVYTLSHRFILHHEVNANESFEEGVRACDCESFNRALKQSLDLNRATSVILGGQNADALA